MAKKSNAGRPTVMTPETVKKLEDGFKRGYNDTQACLYAGITRVTLKNYQDKHPEYISRKQMLKENLKMRALDTLFHHIGGNAEDDESLDDYNADLALKTLERLDKANWSTRQESTGAGGKDLIPIQIIDDMEKNK
tara:strand:- start:4469 stop:4876 length:408 start_codon:yes stop_codon:yes gene_type:complete